MPKLQSLIERRKVESIFKDASDTESDDYYVESTPDSSDDENKRLRESKRLFHSAYANPQSRGSIPPPTPGSIPPPPGANPKSNRQTANDHGLVPIKANLSGSRSEDLTPLTDEQCMIATPWLRGMDLKTKEWGEFFIDELNDVVWNEKAFDNLVLPEKGLVWEFAEAKNLANDKYDDFIAGKGMSIFYRHIWLCLSNLL
jgi:hypothetical protein